VVDPTPLNIVISYVQAGLTSINYLASTLVQAILSFSDSSTQVVTSLANWILTSVSGGGSGAVATDTYGNTVTLTGTSPGVISATANYLGLNSNSIRLTVLPPPIITSQPSSLSVYESATATFTVVATDLGPITYQWSKNGTPITGATAASYTTPATTLADNSVVYKVQLTGASGTISSVNAILTVLQSAPSIVTPPASQSVITGQTAQFTVTAAGLPNLAYQWYKNGNLITGATSSAYSTPATIGDNGSTFSVKVTNAVNNISSNSATLTVQQSSLTDLVISEISSCYYTNYDCWFEVYNPTNSNINLNAYTVKSTSIDIVSNSISTQTYNLPSVVVGPDSYVLLSGNYSNKAQVGVQNIKLKNGNLIPYWTSNGSIEILKNGSTTDFVAFGSSSQKSTSTDKWNGANVAALPYSASDYGKSIVRAYPRTADTNSYSAADWTSVSWVTPAGRNDIPADTADNDGDGIPDSAEVAGGTYAGLDLYAMGARTNQKDVFLEVDQMISTDPGIIVRKEALQKVVDVFSANSIQVHIDAGNAFNTTFSTADFNLGQGSNQLIYEKCVTLDQTTCTSNTSTRRSIYDWKEQYMDLRRRLIFHYALFANSQNTNGFNGNSGLAELVGNDLIISLGNWGLSTSTTSNTNKTINYQASTLMHELGHNLGLRHGGFEDTNYKPNYWSVMNYMYQLNGLDPDAKSITAYQRWRKEKGDGTPLLCNLVASPCGSLSQFIMNFSNGTSASLNEASLLESANIGRGANAGAYADWNLSGSITNTPVSLDLNADGSQTILQDHNDWANLVFPFSRNGYSNSGVSLTNSAINLPVNLISNDRQPIAAEYDLNSR
jgi:Immunoglobulin domain/Metallo-peptidase family M12B Reprolysin-like